MRNMNSAVAVTAAAIALSSSSLPAAEPAHAAAKVQQLLTQPLEGVQGKEVTMLTVEYPPGGVSQPHRHDADVFVYVLEGAIVMQVDGQEPVTVRRGETFRELPGDVHRQSANASKTEPARFLVFVIKEPGKPVTRPVENK